MGGSHATSARPPRALEVIEDDDPLAQALAEYRETLDAIRAAITRGGPNTDALVRALWRMGDGERVLVALARQRVRVAAVADEAVAEYRASLEPPPSLTVVRPT